MEGLKDLLVAALSETDPAVFAEDLIQAGLVDRAAWDGNRPSHESHQEQIR